MRLFSLFVCVLSFYLYSNPGRMQKFTTLYRSLFCGRSKRETEYTTNENILIVFRSAKLTVLQTVDIEFCSGFNDQIYVDYVGGTCHLQAVQKLR